MQAAAPGSARPHRDRCNGKASLLQSRLLPVLVFLSLSAPVTGNAGGVSFDSSQNHLREGVQEYSNSAFDKAERKFLEALESRPGDPQIAYNLGNSYYKQGKYKEALQEYVQAAAGDSGRVLKQKSIYNTGNALFRLGKLEEAATAYKKALELDPSDMDSKYNLEFVREQMRKNPDSGNSKNPDDPSGKGDNPDDRSDNEGSDDSPNPGSDPADSQTPPDPSQSGEQEPVQQAQNPPPAPPQSTQPQGAQQQASATGQNGELTEEQAERWLSSLNEDLKRFQKRKSQQRSGGSMQPEKDW